MTHQSKQAISDAEHAPDEYRVHILQLRDILNNQPPDKPNFEVTDYPSFYSSDGRRYTVTRKRRFEGVAHFKLCVHDLHDSFWFYPLLSEKIVGTPIGVTEANSHSEYYHAKVARRRGVG